MKHDVTPAHRAALALTALLALAGGAATASVPDTNGVIHGCYQITSGKFRIVDSDLPTGICGRAEHPLSWNHQGPAGPTGPQGPAGSGAATFTYVSQQGPDGTAVRAFCPAGTRVSGGGGFSLDTVNGLIQNYPISDESGTIAWGTTAVGWQVAAENFAAATAFVICADNAP